MRVCVSVYIHACVWAGGGGGGGGGGDIGNELFYAIIPPDFLTFFYSAIDPIAFSFYTCYKWQQHSWLL